MLEPFERRRFHKCDTANVIDLVVHPCARREQLLLSSPLPPPPVLMFTATSICFFIYLPRVPSQNSDGEGGGQDAEGAGRRRTGRDRARTLSTMKRASGATATMHLLRQNVAPEAETERRKAALAAVDKSTEKADALALSTNDAMQVSPAFSFPRNGLRVVASVAPEIQAPCVDISALWLND